MVMVTEETERIGWAMREAVESQFTTDHLRQEALSYLAVKTSGRLSFGELTILHYRMFGGTSPGIYKAAAAVELLILALDIFDDLQDQDQKQMPWCINPPALAMNVAIGLTALSHDRLYQVEDVSAERKLGLWTCMNDLLLKAVNGQHTDLANEIHSEEDYLRMIAGKSGSLTTLACLIGTCLATDKDDHTVRLYAKQIGVIQQIRNDIRDICRWDDKNDFLHKKRTLLLLFLLESDQPEFEVFRDYMEGRVDKSYVEERREQIMALIESSGAIEYAEAMCAMLRMEAEDEVRQLELTDDYMEQLLVYF
ncbi:polyprenyl synthetase family protein [Gorillibacterium massiliense]|uniref:polyprenyl synthetase family protein n=1 Tax=Gorillibacterium massiliense TaxID=1280390 RepID=UPI0004B49480|nr:polyprenyl synthetase family protein [Gorillibacterium massiliense]